MLKKKRLVSAKASKPETKSFLSQALTSPHGSLQDRQTSHLLLSTPDHDTTSRWLQSPKCWHVRSLSIPKKPILSKSKRDRHHLIIGPQGLHGEDQASQQQSQVLGDGLRRRLQELKLSPHSKQLKAWWKPPGWVHGCDLCCNVC